MKTFEELCVHGFLPLVHDPDQPGGLRFARVGYDRAEQCVSRPDELPDGLIELRVFGNNDERQGWMASAREFGGNAISVIEGPNAGPVSVVLLVRHDRESLPGDTLDDVIALVSRAWDERQRKPGSARESLADLGKAYRAQAQETAVKARQNSQWEKRWERERSFLEGRILRAGHQWHPKPDDDLEIEIMGKDVFSTLKGRISKTESGITIAVDLLYGRQIEDDVIAPLVALLEASGWTLELPEGRMMFQAPSMTQDVAAGIEAMAELARPLVQQAIDLQDVRNRVDEVLGDADLSKVLRRMADGFPVAAAGYGGTMCQMGARTGSARTVPGTRMRKAINSGLVEPVFWTSYRDGDAQSLNEMKHLVFGLTETGLAIARRDRLSATQTYRRDKQRLEMWRKGPLSAMQPVPVPSLDRVNAHLEDAGRKRLRVFLDGVRPTLRVTRSPALSDDFVTAVTLYSAGLVERVDGEFRKVARDAFLEPGGGSGNEGPGSRF